MPQPETRPRFLSLVSPYTGLVRTAEPVVAAPDDGRLVHVECETGDCAPLIGDPGHVAGGGSGRSLDAALAAAVGEVAERYSARWLGDAEPVVATAEELGDEAVAPERFALFSERQYAQADFPYARFTSRTPLAWVRAATLPDFAPAWLPAELVYLSWASEPGAAPISRPTSSGLAAGSSFGQAVLSGLFELLERDAFMITWGARLSWPRLAWSDHGPLGDHARRYLEPTGLTFAALDLTAVWEVPCVVGLARSSVPGEVPLGVGASAAATVEQAVEKALDEAIRVRSWARALVRLDPEHAGRIAPDEICRFEEHVAFYGREEHAAACAFLDASATTRPAESVPPLEGDLLAELCERLARQGASAYCVDVTAPDIRAAGLSVARVVAPELCPLDVDHALRLRGGRRRYEAPVALGFADRPLVEDELNPDPHPFP